MSSQQANIESLSTDRDNNIATPREAGTVSSPNESDAVAKPVASSEVDGDYESEEEWEDTPPSGLDFRGKQDRPNVGAAQNATDGGKKKPVK